MLTFVFALLTSFSLAQINLVNINAEENLGSAAVVFVKGEEADFDGVVVEGTNYYDSNVKEAIQSTGDARAYLFLPDGFDTVKTRYQYVITNTDQYTFSTEYDSNDHPSWNVVSESGFVTLSGFNSGEGEYYVHVRYKLIGSDEIYRAASTYIVVDNTAPGLDVTWDPTVPTDSTVTVVPMISGIYKYGSDAENSSISSLEYIGYKKGVYDNYNAYLASVEIPFDLTPVPLKVNSTFDFYVDTNGSYTVCVIDRAGNISMKSVTIDNIYKNLKIEYLGELNQEVNSVSAIDFRVIGDQLGNLSRIEWYLSVNGAAAQLITEGVDQYKHNTENKVAEYSITVMIKGSTIGAAAVNFKVTPKKVGTDDLTWDAVTIRKIYDGTDNVEQEITNLIVKAMVLGELDDVVLTISKKYYETIHVGDYINVFAEFEVSGDDASQFDFGVFEYNGIKRILIDELGQIKVRTIDVDLSASDRYYDGTDLVLIDDYNMTNVVAADEDKLSLNIYPSDTKTNIGYGKMDTVIAGTNKLVKTYVELNSDDDALLGDYKLNVAELTVNILKISVKITLEDKTVNYGDEIVYNHTSSNYNSLLVEAGKMVGEETLDSIGYDFGQIVINGGNALPRNVAEYDISLSGQTETTNYTYTYEGGKLVIIPIELKVVLKDEITGKKYDGVDEYLNLQNPDLYNFETLVSGDENFLSKVIYSTSVLEIKNVGLYDVFVRSVEFTDAALANNYIIKSENKEYVIERKLVRLTVTVADKVYDGTDSMSVVSCVFSDLVVGEALDVSCPTNSFKAASKHVEYDGEGNVKAQNIDYEMIVSSTADGLVSNYEWIGYEGLVVNSESENYKVPTSAKINPRPIDLSSYQFISKSYDGNAKVEAGQYLLNINLGGSLEETIELKWSANETGYATVNKSNGYSITVTLADAQISDYLTFKASDYVLEDNYTLGEITPVKVYVDFIKVNGEVLTIVYDAQVHLFNDYGYYTYTYENQGVKLQGNENQYVARVNYKAYKDASRTQLVVDNQIIDINMDADKNVLPYYIEIESVELQGLTPVENYEFIFENIGQIIISKQPLQVTFKGHERAYVGTAVTNEFDKNDFNIIGILGTEEYDLTNSITGIKYTFYTGAECTADQRVENPINVGTYYVVGLELTPLGGFDLSNYDITFFKTGTLVITKVALNVRYQTSAIDTFYNGLDNKLDSDDFVYEGLVGDDLDRISSINVSYNIDGLSSIVKQLKDVKRTDGYDGKLGLSTEVLGYVIDVTEVSGSFINNYNVTYKVHDVGSNQYIIKPLLLSLYIEAVHRDYDTTSNVEFVQHSEAKPRYQGALEGETFVINYLNGKAVSAGVEMKDVGVYDVDYDLEVIANSPAKESNYYWNKPLTPSVTISPKVLNVENFVTNYVCAEDETRKCKVYDGSSAIPADFVISATEESGVFAGEEAVIAYDQVESKFVQTEDKTLAAIDAGAAIMLIKNISISGNLNYIIDNVQTTWEYPATIEKRTLDVEKFIINDFGIVKQYDGNALFEALNIVVTNESGLQERETVLDTVTVNATAVYNNANVAIAKELIITMTSLSGTHASNYVLSANTTTRTNEVDGYEVKITAIVIMDADIKANHTQKVYDAKTSVPEGFIIYAENAYWPETRIELEGYSSRYEYADVSATANIQVNNIASTNSNYVIGVTDNKVVRVGVITKRLIPLSSLVITPMSKTYDGTANINIDSITVLETYIQSNDLGVLDVVEVISPSFGTFVEFDGSDYIESISVGENKFIRLNDISLDVTSSKNYALVDDEENEAISYIYSNGTILALDIYISFIDGTSIYNGTLIDLTDINRYSITVDDGFVIPDEIKALTNITPKITLNGAVVTDVINVGVYTVLPPASGINVANEENYNFIVEDGTYEITKRVASISLKEGLSSTYNGEIVDISTISNWNIEERNDEKDTGFVNAVTSVIPNAGMGVTIKDAGQYYVVAGTINGIDINNYSIVYGNAVIYTVNPKLINVIVDITDREYDGTSTIDKSLINAVLLSTDYIKEETLTIEITNGTISAPDASATAYKVSGYTITLMDGTNGGLAKNYVIGSYGDEEITISPRTILLQNLLLEDPAVLYRVYNGEKRFTGILKILVKEDVPGGLVIKEGNSDFDNVEISFDGSTIEYYSQFVGAGNYITVNDLTASDANYRLEASTTTFTDGDGSLILKKNLIPQNFIVSPTTKVYDGKVDETSRVTVTAVGIVDGDITLIGVEIESAILDSRMVGTRTLTVKNIAIYDLDDTQPRIYNYELDETALESYFEFIITAKPISVANVDAYFDGNLISHANPLRMPYIPGNNSYTKLDTIELKFKDGTILHEDDVYNFEITSVEFFNQDGSEATEVNSRETTYYKVVINFALSINDNYDFDDSVTYITIENSGIIDPMGVIIKAKEFTKVYGDSETNHAYKDPTNYTWVYYDGGLELGTEDYNYLTNAIDFNADRTITMLTQQVSETGYPINITWDTSKTDNYDIRVEDITLKILPREIKIKANDGSIAYYSDEEVTLTYELLDGTSLVIWDEATALPSASGAQDTLRNVLSVIDASINPITVPYTYGEYRITKNVLADASNPNYTISVVDGKFNVTDDKEAIVSDITVSGWSNESVSVTFTATDIIPDLIGTPSGINQTGAQYCDAAGNNCYAINYVDSQFVFNVTANGEYTIKVKDNAGNIKLESVSVYTILKIAPDFDIISTYETGHYINEDLDIKIEAYATTSAKFDSKYYSSVCVSIDGGECAELGEVVYAEDDVTVYTAEFDYTFSSNVSGVHTVKFVLTDAAGNTREKTLEIKAIYVTTTTALTVNEDVMLVSYSFNNYDKVSAMINTYELKYFFSRQYITTKPELEAFNAHGVGYDIVNGAAELRSPAGLNGNYRINILLRIKISEGVYDNLVYQSDFKTIKRASSQPVALNLSDVVVANDSGMKASYLSTDGSSVIVSNQKESVSTLSSRSNTFDFVVKYDSFGNEEYRTKLVVDGTYSILDVKENDNLVYVLLTGTISNVNGMKFKGENIALVLVISSGNIIETYEYEIALNGQIMGMDVSDHNVVLIGSIGNDALVVFTDFEQSWEKVLINTNYSDVAIDDNMIVVVGSTNEIQFNIDDVIYNGGVSSHGASDGIMVVLKLDGTVNYVKRLSSSSDDNINLVEINNSNIIITGTTYGERLYYSKYASIITKATGDKNAFIITYNDKGYLNEFSTLDGEGDEEYKSLSISNNTIITSVKTSSAVVTPLARSGSPIMINGEGEKGFIITYSEALTIEDVAASPTNYSISLAALNRNTSQLMILSANDSAYILQTQRFVTKSDIIIDRVDSIVSVLAEGINVKEIRVMKDNEFVSVNFNQFEVLENGVYEISVIDEYDRVATKSLVIDSFVVDEPVLKVASTDNMSSYVIAAIATLIVLGCMAIRKRKENA